MIFFDLIKKLLFQADEKSVDDIKLDQIDFKKHMITMRSGEEWYRVVRKGDDPLLPTGKPNRFVSTPSNFDIIEFQNKFRLGDPTASLLGTASTIACKTTEIALLESHLNLLGADVYKITFKSNVELVDMDSICKAEGVNKPYTKGRTEIWQKFYGKKIKGLRYESSKDFSVYNIVIFRDWFKDFESVVKVEKQEEQQ